MLLVLRAVAILQLLVTTAAPEARQQLVGLGAALLDSDFMPPSLLLQSDPTPRPQTPAINNASVSIALSTMDFHRRMMNEYLCRGYMAEGILGRLQRDAEEGESTQRPHGETKRRRGGEPSGAAGDSGRRLRDSLRARVLLADQGSSNYRNWLERSAVLEDIYRHFEHDGRGERDVQLPVEGRGAADDEEDSSPEKGRGSSKGQRVTSKPRPSKEKGRRPPSPSSTAVEDSLPAGQHNRDEYLEFPPHHEVAEAGWTGLGFGMEDLYDITLTAVAFLAFGIFILNVFLGIVTQKTGTQTVMVANSSLPLRNRRMARMDDPDSSTHERIARWAEEELPESFQETPEEAVGRLALLSLNVAIRPKPAHCLQAALCRANRESRGLEGQAKYWLPMWSLGMSWLARRGGSEAGTSALFSGALENLRAATLGLAGARCHLLFPPC